MNPRTCRHLSCSPRHSASSRPDSVVRQGARLASHFQQCAGAALVAVAASTAGAEVITWNVNQAIPATNAGLYLKIDTQEFVPTAGAGLPGWDINPYGSTSLNWSASSSAPSPVTTYVRTQGSGGPSNLAPGTVIGPASSFANGTAAVISSTGVGSNGWQPNSLNYVGFRFHNDTLNRVNYAYAAVRVGATAADRTLLRVSYEDSGAPIAIPCPTPVISQASPQLVPYSFSSPREWTASGFRPNSQGATLTVTARGQLGSTTRFFTVKIDGTTIASNVLGAGSGAGTCTTSPSSAALEIPAAQFQQFAADGALTVRIEPSINATSEGCRTAELQVQLDYVRDIVDCDGNGVDDECQVANQASSADCNGNGLVDSCESASEAVDCDRNGLPDVCDIAGGAENVNGNGLPDVCEIRYGDLNLDGQVDGMDLSALLAVWGLPDPPYGDLDGDGLVGGSDLTAVLARWGPAPWLSAPALTSVSPPSGSPAGGTPITLTGTNLLGTSEVRVGGAAATDVQVVSSTTVTAVTPPGVAGVRNVSVATSSGTVTLLGGFTYVAPPTLPAWATLIEPLPDPAIVTSATLRSAITATGYAWRVRDTATQIEMVLIPPGMFQMGCSPSNQVSCQQSENPIHTVLLTQPFYMGRYEVTQAQWTARMGSNPSSFQSASAQVPLEQVPTRPVERVSWNTIHGFLSATGMRLPTEAEWEYAYRAGTTTAFHSMPGYPSGTNDDNQLGTIASFASNSASQTRPVGQKAGNGFGLHDMSGNVWEWVNDRYSSTYYSSSPSVDPPGPSSGTSRVLRGGSWVNSSGGCRSSGRNGSGPSSGGDYVGFRVARAP